MNLDPSSPIVIVGAGPAGLTLALVLARYGIKAVVIEKNLERSNHTKALSIQPRTIELIDRLGLLEKFLAHGQTLQKNNFWVNKKHVSTLDYGKLPSKCNYLLAITQPNIERLLEEALTQEGVYVSRGVECLSVDALKDHNILKLKDLKNNTLVEFTSPYVVIAEGGKSPTRTDFLHKGLIKLEKKARYASNFIMGDFTIQNYPFKRDERNTFIANKKICVFIPMVYPEVRIVTFGLKTKEDLEPNPDEFLNIVKQMTEEEMDLSQGKWMNRFYPSRFMVDKFQVNNLFFVGDAAHIMSPIGAQGINSAIEDAYNLGWKLGLCLRNTREKSLLSSYEIERQEAAKSVLDATHELHSKLSNPFLNFLFMQQLKLLQRPEINQLVMFKQTQFFMNYSVGARSNKRALKKSEMGKGPFLKGSRFLNIWSDSSKTFLFSLLSNTRLTILVNLLSDKYHSEQAYKEFADNNDVVVIIDINSPTKLHFKNAFTVDTTEKISHRLKQSAPFIIISPDNYIYDTSFQYKGITKHMSGSTELERAGLA